MLTDNPMDVLIALLALGLLMLAAYRGYSVILFAPLVALGAVLLTQPAAVAPVFSDIFMDKLVGFVKLYFPVFLLGAVFGKLIEFSGFSRSIVSAVTRLMGQNKAMPVIILVCALLTYGGVSLFVVVFAVYPFAAEMFRQSQIPKRLMPATIALGAFTFTMDALPGSPQIQNIIPTTFYGTTSWAAPWLGVLGSAFVAIGGWLYLEAMRRKAQRRGEGYGSELVNEPETPADLNLPHPVIALLPLIIVGVANLLFTWLIPQAYGSHFLIDLPGLKAPMESDVKKMVAIWAVMAALLCGIITIFLFAGRSLKGKLADGSKVAVGGAMLAALNTASEYGFGGVIAALPGFVQVADALKAIPNPLLNQAITINILSGITGSSSGGMSIALAAMADRFVESAHAAGIPLEVMHRVASMAAGGMDTLPHNGAIITLLAVTGLTHRQAYKPILGITLFKILGAFFIIGVYYATGLV
ncbi:GntP family permease [Klebsiella aerogenes]|jgi:H+/gluconate symporter-like permease|uniref:Putative transporter, membrane protein n=4 Tax=Klebsiella/Raoultella group TaxID=2890311 RepID=A0A0H3FNM1_KLEAK|nr:putative transporter, membrane protein [Klebsiella aerogenes KCTC 2190]AMH12257.2 GntP family permease [Klebsiella aerogenes]EUL30806.1 citrate transporter [Klebsiella aerogenes UCI 48]EUL44031.1 citrate transporter [Klebsiella aerogenes UCI 47]EUL46973.1 citrate transporter [Klebsiella aerogenes UCI 46]EUL51639.1 citrate transporter [Klebsiella aerogenes UCI 45]EUL81669.1 citrate transporter [Klebsiella aerogenes UCI 27]EUL84794.1 citrate transporter [Klebsiella aerogenes UCI 28]EUL9223